MTELSPVNVALLRKLRVAAPAKLLAVGTIPAEDAEKKRRRPPPGPKKRPAA